MVNKLKWAFAQKSWSLVLKGLLLAVLWYIAPWWVFFIAALLLYVAPAMQLARALPFFALALGAAYLLPKGVVGALYVGVLFWGLFGVKELWVVDRRRATTSLAVLTLFPYLFAFFEHFATWAMGAMWWAMIGVGVVFFALSLLVFRQAARDNAERVFFLGRQIALLTMLATFVFWQFAFAVSFLPLNAMFQTALLFLWAATIILAGAELLAGELVRQKVFAYASFAGAVTLLILATLP